MAGDSGHSDEYEDETGQEKTALDLEGELSKEEEFDITLISQRPTNPQN